MHRLFRPAVCRAARTFFNDGFRDNASLETVYRAVVKSGAVADKLLDFYAKSLDAASIESLAALSAQGATVCVPLQPYLGDPHRVLLAYSLTGGKVEKEKDGNIVVEAKIGDEKQRIKIIDHELIGFVAQELLKKLGQPTTPEGARAYIDSMIDGADAIAQKLLAKTPVEASPLEKAMAEIAKEKAPIGELKNLDLDSAENVKWQNLPYPYTGKIEGKKKYFYN